MSLTTLKVKISKMETRAKAINDDTSTTMLDDILTSLNEAMEKFETTVTDDAGEQEQYARYEQIYFNAKQILLEALDKRRKIASEISQPSVAELLQTQNKFLDEMKNVKGGENQEVRLPRVEIAKFSGDLENWLTFKDLFEGMVHENSKLSEIQKHHYLRTLLSGEASILLKHIPLTSDNYKLAWQEIKKRYDRPFLLIKALITRFLDTESINSRLSNIRQTYDRLSETVRVLKQMGDYASSVDPWLIHFMSLKLDQESKKCWAGVCATNNEPSVKHFLEFFEDRCKAAEMLTEEKNKAKSFSTFSSKCFYCNCDHSIHKCESFKTLPIPEKENILRKDARCFRCFKRGHVSKKCPSTFNCQKCQGKHHTFLHKENLQTSHDHARGSGRGIAQINFGKLESSTNILPTALVQISDGFGNKIKCCALLDSGAQASFITNKVCEKLNLRKKNIRIPFEGINASRASYSSGKVDLLVESCAVPNYKFTVSVNVIAGEIGDISAAKVNSKTIDELKQFNLADPVFYELKGIDLLLSASIFFELLGSKKFFHQDENLWIQESKLGYIICGGSRDDEKPAFSANAFLKELNLQDLNAKIERLWEMDELSSPTENLEDVECEKFYISNVKRTDDGRYIVNLPFMENRMQIGNSYSMAEKRFYFLEKRFDRDSSYKHSYVEFMRDYIEQGHMEKIPAKEIHLAANHNYYLPHHGIMQHSGNKIKLRVVFDASAKSSNGVSLNDILLPGPNLQLSLHLILTRFRFHKFVFTADIQQMYRQILITEDDRDYQRVLWRENKWGTIEHFRLRTVTYGTSSAPYLAIRTLRQLAKDESRRFPNASHILQNNIYMDDILVGSDTIRNLLDIKIELINLLAQGKFCLKKWSSNNGSLLEDISENDKIQSFSFNDESSCLIKTLGMQWNPSADCFTFKIDDDKDVTLTKRILLSELARIFDPFGWIAPVLISLKILFQETWAAKCDWDDEIPLAMREEWKKIRSELKSLEQLKIERWIGLGERYELHGFSDASEKAYGAVLYLKATSIDGTVKTTLIACKTKLAPLKLFQSLVLNCVARISLPNSCMHILQFLIN